jgi:hypothetical protein
MSGLSSIVEGLISPVTGLISEFIEDKDKAAEIAYKVSTLAATQAHEQVMGQLDINKSEAQTGSLFIGGWRPAVGWTCVGAMLLNFVITPMFGPVIEAYTTVEMVPLNWEAMSPVLLGMLGLATNRTAEKIKGVAKA